MGQTTGSLRWRLGVAALFMVSALLALSVDAAAANRWPPAGLAARYAEPSQRHVAVESDDPPRLSDATVSPNLWGACGGTSYVTALASDEKDVRQVYAIVTGSDGSRSELQLTGLNAGYEDAFQVPYNIGATALTYTVEVFAEDTTGQISSEPAGTVRVEPAGTPNPGYLEFEPVLVRFGAHSISDSEGATRTVLLSNHGKPGSPPISGLISSSDPQFTLPGSGREGLPFTIPPGGSQTIEVEFRPSAKGQQERRLTLTRSDGREQSGATVSLFGWGLK
jgi:hypothetical protein